MDTRPLLYRSRFLLRVLGAVVIAGYLYSPFSTAEEVLSQQRVAALVAAYVTATLLQMVAARGRPLGPGLQRMQIVCDLALTIALPVLAAPTRLPALFFLYLAFIDY